MNLPFEIREKINDLYANLKSNKLQNIRQNITNKYKTESGQNKSLIESNDEAICYAISRMPATYAVLYTLVDQLISQGLLNGVSNVLDLGCGTGTGFLAISQMFEGVDVTLVEREKNMIDIFNRIFPQKMVQNQDILNYQSNENFDLVVCSYVLNEMTKENKFKTIDKMLQLSKKYILIIDTGTPKVYEEFMNIKSYVISKGYKIIAPCKNEKCDLKNDYCQFYARVERSSLQKMSKDAKLSYEDEKYFYLLISTSEIDFNMNKNRIIRRPEIKKNQINAKVCSNSGTKDMIITKANKQMYLKVKKCKINDEI